MVSNTFGGTDPGFQKAGGAGGLLLGMEKIIKTYMRGGGEGLPLKTAFMSKGQRYLFIYQRLCNAYLGCTYPY